jgi:uncharacterized protein (DUF362 family)
MKPIVYISRLEGQTDALKNQFFQACRCLCLAKDLENAKAVFIKPNLTYPNYKKGVTTCVEFIEALVRALLELSPRLKIYVGDGEGGYNSFSMTEAFRKMGFFELENRYEQVKILNLSELPAREVEIPTLRGPCKISLPVIFFDEIDFSITCPVPKVHCMTQITLAYKNQWGCQPDVMRLKNHYLFDEIISQICDKLKFRYAFLDGKHGLDKNGPMMGDPVEVNWFVASNSLGAFDMVVSDMMGFDWRRIGHLKMAEKYGFMPIKDKIQIIGDPESLRKKFTLKRNFWNYPALAAFRSRKLTDLFYFSMWAKLLHDVMYIFRKRPIEP